MNNINLQDIFLNNGYKITGTVIDFDNYVAFVETDNGQHINIFTNEGAGVK